MKINTKKLTTLAMLSALAYILMVFIKIPVVLFLRYEPKDVIIVIGGFIYGPLASLAMSVVVSFVEMVTVSETGPIGAVMNVISTCSFACTAAFLYRKRHTLGGAAVGLACGVAVATAVMLLWNYLLVPVYTPNISREAVAGMLLPAFLPFNLLKGGLNAAAAMLLYKPIKKAIGSTHLLPETGGGSAPASKINTGVIIASVFVIITCILFILALQGKI